MESDSKRARTEGGEMDGATLEVISSVNELQAELEKVNEEASDKVLEVEMRYNKIRRPIYQKRNQELARIPHFWRDVFLKHPVLGNGVLNEDDLNILQYCTEFDVQDSDDIKSGFTMRLKFSPNPYFEDAVLEKRVAYDDAGQLTAQASKPHWKEGMNPNVEDEPAPGSKRRRQDYNFFLWWIEEAQHADGKDELAEILKDDLFQQPLRHYLSEEAPAGAEQELYWDEEEEDEDEEGDEEEEEEEGGEEQEGGEEEFGEMEEGGEEEEEEEEEEQQQQ